MRGVKFKQGGKKAVMGDATRATTTFRIPVTPKEDLQDRLLSPQSQTRL